MNEHNLSKLMDFIGNDMILSTEISSLSQQVFQKLLKQERIRVENRQIIVEDSFLQEDIKQLILNIICNAKGNYKVNIDKNFVLSDEEENELIEDLYEMIMTEILNVVIGVEL